jgi:hypothetical protein
MLIRRLARPEDVPELRPLISAAIAELQEGFTALELMATLSGRPLYEAAGHVALEDVEEAAGGVPVPLLRMRKELELGLTRGLPM